MYLVRLHEPGPKFVSYHSDCYFDSSGKLKLYIKASCFCSHQKSGKRKMNSHLLSNRITYPPSLTWLEFGTTIPHCPAFLPYSTLVCPNGRSSHMLGQTENRISEE